MLKKKIESAVDDILASEAQLIQIKALGRIYGTHPELSMAIKAYAVALGHTIQIDDPWLQEYATVRLADEKYALKAKLVEALEEAKPKEYRRFKNPAVKFKMHMRNHEQAADNIVNHVEKFWTEKLAAELQTQVGVR